MDVDELIRRKDAGEELDDDLAEQDAKYNPANQGSVPGSQPASGTASPTETSVKEEAKA